MGNSKFHEKRRQISFRITEIAEDRLRKAAALFDMEPALYAKAVLYRDLGVYDEPLDRRRRGWHRKQKQQQEGDDEWSEQIEPMEESENP